ncbi:MAG TPA: DUF2071 domain-containing protein [Gaiellaceae bacterium]|jgi:uncharacterized protein YqjF (DUF2071 family)|nr:DUF2071 domain-containing protein [Gaiellaceae bacterium]
MLDGLRAASRQARSLQQLDHRPWPLPERRWLMGQTWEDLMFAHWRVPLEQVLPHVPSELEVELHDGSAWVGITPFRVTGLRSRGSLPVPVVSSFLELNVRTYVRTAAGWPGVWFFSLDATSRLAVRAARRQYRLPYFDARIALDRADGWMDVECARLGERGKVFSGRYRPDGDPVAPAPGSLEAFLVERYRLYATDRSGGLYHADIHHAPWVLRPAQAEIELTSIAPFQLRGEPLCHVAERQDVLIWPLEAAGAQR